MFRNLRANEDYKKIVPTLSCAYFDVNLCLAGAKMSE